MDESSARTASACCRTTPCSTRLATSRPGNETDPLELYVIGGVKVGISICEDVWSPDGPLAHQADGGAELAVNINGSPYHRGKAAARERMLATRAADAHSALVYVNQVGGQDELVFDGCSLAFDPEGRLLARGPQFRVRPVDRRRPGARRVPSAAARSSRSGLAALAAVRRGVAPRRWPMASRPTNPLIALLAPEEELYEALVLGTRDYCRKNGFTDVVIGLSGGIDSSLVAVIAAEALGAEHVHGVSMPSRYSSDGSKSDARALADNLGIEYRTIPIEPAFTAFLDMLGPSFEGRPPGLTQENLQSRCRGQVLMALSNEFGWMVLTTGNKSEMAVGYFTIYGDSVGGYAVIKDVLKTQVFALSRYVNERAGREVIPEAVLAKPPSAELRPDQRDDQSLPPYDAARPDPRGLRRGGPDGRRDRRARERRSDRPASHPSRRHRRVQAPAEPTGRARHDQSVRSRPPHADHERLPLVHPSVRTSIFRGPALRWAATLGCYAATARERMSCSRSHIDTPATTANAAPRIAVAVRPWASNSRVATMEVTPRPSVPQAIIVPRPRPGAPGISVGPMGIDDTMPNSKPAMKIPSRARPGTSDDCSTDRASPVGTMIAAARMALRSLPQRSVRAAEVVDAVSSRSPIPNVTATRPIVSTPNSSSNHGPNVTNSDCAADIRPNMPATASQPTTGMRPIGAGSRSLAWADSGGVAVGGIVPKAPGDERPP